eukprot:14677814-Heterocapsa_arctica.AAC.1
MRCEDVVEEETSEGENLLSTGEGSQTWEDLLEGWPNRKLVAKDRRDEMERVRSQQVYTRVSRPWSRAETGEGLIRTGWADKNEGIMAEPEIRMRWKTQEFNIGP